MDSRQGVAYRSWVATESVGTERADHRQARGEPMAQIFRRPTWPDRRALPVSTDQGRVGTDRYRPGELEQSSPISTAIPDPIAYGAMLARAVEHPAVRAAMFAPFRAGYIPGPVDVPIADILGDLGHEYCQGRVLAGPDLRAAQHQRDVWINRRRLGMPSQGWVQPRTTPIWSFAGGTVVFRFAMTPQRTYTLADAYPMPRVPPAHGVLARVGRSCLVEPYWRRNLRAPYGTLLRTADTYLNAEAGEEGVRLLATRVAKSSHDVETAQFLNQLIQVIDGSARGMHPYALYTAAQYGHGNDRAFVRALASFLGIT